MPSIHVTSIAVFAVISTKTSFSRLVNTETGNSTGFNSATERKFGGQFEIWLQTLNRYGCWCYFASDYGKGRSQPVDELDRFCKQLHEGYECVEIDAELAGDSNCTAWDQSYSGTKNAKLIP